MDKVVELSLLYWCFKVKWISEGTCRVRSFSKNKTLKVKLIYHHQASNSTAVTTSAPPVERMWDFSMMPVILWGERIKEQRGGTCQQRQLVIVGNPVNPVNQSSTSPSSAHLTDAAAGQLCFRVCSPLSSISTYFFVWMEDLLLRLHEESVNELFIKRWAVSPANSAPKGVSRAQMEGH